MNGKLKKNIGFSLMIFAFFFLFEPSFGLIDPIPDIIGYAILCSALINLADINDRIYASFKSFRLGMLFSALRAVTYIVLENVFVDDEQTVGLLLFVFIFAVCDFIWIIPGYRALFDGLLSLGMFEGGDAVYYRKREKGRNASEKLKGLTIVFLIVKNLIWVLPELTTLEANTSNEFIGIMRILSAIIMIPLSLVWLIKMTVYIVRIKKDRPFIETLENKYRERTENAEDFFTCRSVCTYLSVMIIAFVLSLDIYSENVNYLPDVLFYAVLICSVFFLRKYSKAWIPISILSLFGGVSSILIFISEKAFFDKYFIESIRRDPDAYESYNRLLALYIIQAVIFAVTAVSVLLFLRVLFKKNLLIAENEEKTIAFKNKGFIAKAVIYSLMSLISAAGSVFYVISLPLHKFSWVYAYSNVICGVISLCFAVSAYVLIQCVKDKLKSNTQPYL